MNTKRKTKPLLISLLVVALAFLIALGNLSSLSLVNAFAANVQNNNVVALYDNGNGNGDTNGGNDADEEFYSESVAFFAQAQRLSRTVSLGGHFFVPQYNDGVNLVVTAPNGRVVYDSANEIDLSEGTLESGELEFLSNQLGNYSVVFTQGNNEFSYLVASEQDRDFSLITNLTAQDFMPAFRRAQSNQEQRNFDLAAANITAQNNPDAFNNIADTEILRIPSFSLVFTNELGEEVELEDAEYEVRFTAGRATVQTRAGAAVTTPIDRIPSSANPNLGNHQLVNIAPGALTVTLAARPTNAGRWFTRDFSINVQTGFISGATPTISTVNVPLRAPINTRVNIPAASASDIFSGNTFVLVTVSNPQGNPVLQYEVDEHGHVVLDEEGRPVALKDGEEDIKFTFDNTTRNMHFYPTALGRYSVTYQAVNGNGLKSAEHRFFIEIVDNAAPIITDIDFSLIPAVWGRDEVRNAQGLIEQTVDITVAGTTTSFPAFNLPFPSMTDNLTQEKDLELTVRLQNPRGRTIARWIGTVEQFNSENGVEFDSAFNRFLHINHRVPFTAQDMVFSFGFINFTETTINTEEQQLGDWTFEYSVRDEAGNGGTGRARAATNLELRNTFSDTVPPRVVNSDFLSSLPEYILLNNANETFIVPTVGVVETPTQGRVIEDYSIISIVPATAVFDATVTYRGTEFTVVGFNDEAVGADITGAFEVSGGDTFIAREINGTRFLTIIQDGKAYAVPLASESARIELRYSAKDSVGNRFVAHETIPNPNVQNLQRYVLVGSVDFLFAGSIVQDLSVSTLFGFDNGIAAETDFDQTRLAGQAWNFGGFDVFGINYRQYTGFEISLTDERGRSVEVSAHTFFYDNHRRLTHLGQEINDTSRFSLHVRDITATPGAGVHRLNIRVFDISGVAQVFGYTFEVKTPEGGYIIEGGNERQGHATLSATGGTRTPAIGRSGALNETFRLTDSYIIHSPTSPRDYNIVRRIRGNAFSLAGSDFTALAAGSFIIRDYTPNFAFNFNPGQAGNEIGKDFNPANAGTFIGDSSNGSLNSTHLNSSTLRRSYPTFTASSSEIPVVVADETEGGMPTFLSHLRPEAGNSRRGRMPIVTNQWHPGEFIELPVIYGFVPGQENIAVTVNVTGPGASTITARQLYIEVDAYGDKTFQRVNEYGARLFNATAGGTTTDPRTTNDNARNTIANATTTGEIAAARAAGAFRYTFDARNADLDKDNIPTGIWTFYSIEDGVYTVRASARTSTNRENTASFSIRIGRTAVPVFTLEGVVQRSAVAGVDTFLHPRLNLSILPVDAIGGIQDFDTVEFRITGPGNSTINDARANTSVQARNLRAAAGSDPTHDFDTGFVFETAGDHTVTITVSDSESGLSSTISYIITVTAASTSGGLDLTVLTVVLIIIGVAVILGAIIYIIRFKPKKAIAKTTTAA